MSNRFLVVSQSQRLSGEVRVVGAKNAVLVIMASLLLAHGKSILNNVPDSADVAQMIGLLRELGAEVFFDVELNRLEVDTSFVKGVSVRAETMNKMRASILVMGPLLARFGMAIVALPGGCSIGARPIDFHLKGFKELGVVVEEEGFTVRAHTISDKQQNINRRMVLEYPSVGATENLLMYAAMLPGSTVIVNAALEPEVTDLIDVLIKMGARIEALLPQCLVVHGVTELKPIVHDVIPDRLEAGALLLAAAITGGSIYLPNARADHLDLFIEKLREMGHTVVTGSTRQDLMVQEGIYLKATQNPRAVSFKTNPYPGFPTDLQAPMFAAQTIAEGTSVIEETVFENRLLHAKELQKMGAQIAVDGNKATIHGVDELYGTDVIASDIRASCALVLAGLVAVGSTKITGIHHWKRGYERLESKLARLGANIGMVDDKSTPVVSLGQPVTLLV